MENKYSINNNIQCPILLVIDQNNKNLGKIKLEEALELAKKAKLDLVLISKNENFGIAKILDFKKFLFNEKKNEKNKNNSTQKVKEINVKPTIGLNDLKRIANNTLDWTKDGNIVKFKIKSPGTRYIFPEEVFLNLYNKFIEFLGTNITIISPLKKNSQSLYMATFGKK